MPIDYTKRPQQPPQPSGPEPSAPQVPAGGAGVNLSKVTLTKAAPAVSLTKHGGGGGILRVNLNWNARPAGGGGFFRKTPQLDLDLGCLFEFADGSKGVVQALGNSFTATLADSQQPLVWLDKDDRSGTSTDGENLFVDLQFTAQIRRVLVFALIYEGAANWAAAQGIVTLFPAQGPQIEVRLDEPRDGARICAVAMLTGGAELTVQREVRYIDGAQRALDQAYDWGMNWTPGRK